MPDAMSQMIAGLSELSSGLNEAALGQQQAVAQLPQVVGGLEQVGQGQSELYEGFSALEGQLGELTQGLSQSVDGLSQVSDGLQSAQQYLGELSSAPDQEIAGWHIPEEALKSEDFQLLFNHFMSEDRTIVTMDVILKDSPYSADALASIDHIQAAVDRALQGTSYAAMEVGIQGVTSSFADLQSISDKDYSRTVILMLIGISLILIVLLRSLVMPLYLVASLVLCYFASMSIAELLFVNIMGYPGLNWATPFFGFVILVALGVDYCIFLMDRFNEYQHYSVTDAILLAMKNMGTVIISAVIILAGTFAAMLPSGVLSLLQIATIVLSGLLMYAFIFLPFFVIVMVKLFGKGNWWPFLKKDAAAITNHDHHKEFIS